MVLVLFSIIAQRITSNPKSAPDMKYLSELSNIEIFLKKPIQSKNIQHLAFMMSSEIRIERVQIFQFVTPKTSLQLSNKIILYFPLFQ
jgi:hypothetical protein